MVFSFLVPCGTAHLFMNVCFILFDSSLHDWVLETRLSFVIILILFGLCCASRALAVSGIPAQFSILGFFWLTDFDRLGLSFASWILKPFFLHGPLDPNSLDFSPFQFFGCPPSLSFFPNSWNLLLLGWKFPSSRFYLWFSHSWFLVVQLICSWMFALYFLIPHCMTGCLRPVYPS